MRQALDIFAKDARRLWPHILVVLALYAAYAALSPEATLSGANSLLEWSGIPSALILAACWALGASVVYEDAPAQRSPFWLTRPYNRASLLAAKVLFLGAFVLAPLILLGIALEARAGVSIAANWGALLGLCLLRSLWLILPALALGAVTRNLMEFCGLLLGLVLLMSLAETHLKGDWLHAFLRLDLLSAGNAAAVLPAVVAAAAVAARQYAARRTAWNRGVLIAAVAGSGLLMPMESAALFSLRAMNPGFHPDLVRVSFDGGVRAEAPGRNGSCLSVAVKVEGLPPGTILEAVKAQGRYGRRVSDSPWREATIQEDGSDGYREIVCDFFGGFAMPAQGMVRGTPMTLETRGTFAVVAVSPVAGLPARRGNFSAGGAGRCEIAGDVNTQLRCNLAAPVSGTITAGLEYPGYRNFANGFGEDGLFPLSPLVYRKFDGSAPRTPGGWPFEKAMARPDARFELRRERVIGYLRRDFFERGFLN